MNLICLICRHCGHFAKLTGDIKRSWYATDIFRGVPGVCIDFETVRLRTARNESVVVATDSFLPFLYRLLVVSLASVWMPLTETASLSRVRKKSSC